MYGSASARMSPIAPRALPVSTLFATPPPPEMKRMEVQTERGPRTRRLVKEQPLRNSEDGMASDTGAIPPAPGSVVSSVHIPAMRRMRESTSSLVVSSAWAAALTKDLGLGAIMDNSVKVR